VTTSERLPWRPVFGTGLARSGGGLYNSLLSVHPQVEVVRCPHLELYRSLRNAIVRSVGDPEVLRASPLDAPMQDHYFTNARIRVLDALLAGTLDLPFEDEWEPFLERAIARADLEASDISARFPELQGPTYRDMFENAVRIVGEERKSPIGAYAGWHDVWVIDLFPALARAFPDARFVIMIRDIRAVVNSVHGMGKQIPDQFVQTMSYARHWRKYVALSLRFLDDPLFEGRLHVGTYDDLVLRPERNVKAMCEVLGVPFDPSMLDTDNFVDPTTGGRWTGNSSFEEEMSGLERHRTSRWRATLPDASVEAIEWLCGAELELAGYDLVTGPRRTYPTSAAVQVLLDEATSFTNWRSDLGDPQEDIGFELLRSSLLALAEPAVDDGLVRRCFLFRETYDALRAGGVQVPRR
jgi:hypothetical protein